MTAPLRQRIAALESENAALRERVDFMQVAVRETQVLCAAAHEACRARGDALSGAQMIHPAFHAFEIADYKMFLDLLEYGVDWDENGHACTVGNGNGTGEPVSDLSFARDEMQDAIEWLKLRGYIELVVAEDKSLHVIVCDLPEWVQ